MNMVMIRTAWVSLGVALSAALPCSATAAETTSAIGEITVTATRREQDAQDVPSSLQVFSGEELDRLGAQGYEDYLSSVPSVSFRDQGNGAKRIGIRGVSNVEGSDFGFADPLSSVGVYLNDVPIQGTSVLPDLALYDLDRIEVLKGPQGTLYGEGAMGGAIKMILNRPDFNDFAAKAEATVSSSSGGGENYGLRAAINIPLVADKAGLRLVGSTRADDGFIDNTTTGRVNDNESDQSSGRLLFLYTPTERLSFEVLALHDEINQEAFPQITLNAGDLLTTVPEDEFNEMTFDLAGLTIGYAFDFAQLTSVTSYYENDREFNARFPAGAGLANLLLGLRGLPLVTIDQEPLLTSMDLKSFAHETRLVSDSKGSFNWILGAFYRDKTLEGLSDVYFTQEDTDELNASIATGGAATASLITPPVWLSRIADIDFEQLAVYGELTFDLGERFQLTTGARWLDETIKMTDSNIGYGLFAFASRPTVTVETADDKVVGKVALAYEATDHHLIYAQAVQGFRSGGPNLNFSLGVGEQGFAPDEIISYELGVKTQWLNNRLLLNAAGYFIDWTDIQSQQVAISPITNLPTTYLGNGGDAEIRGGELEITAALTDRMLFGASAGYNDGEITKGESGVVEGSGLPNLPYWTWKAFLAFEAPLTDSLGWYARVDHEHSDDQTTRLLTAGPNGAANTAPLKSWDMTSLRIGVDGERFGGYLYATNLFDERAQMGRGLTAVGSIRNTELISLTQPRTIGITMHANW